MMKRPKLVLLALAATVISSVVMAGCGKKDDAPQQTQEQQKLREQKKTGD